MPEHNNTPTGSYSLGGDKPKKRGWLLPLLALLGLLLLALILWLLLKGNDEDTAATAPAATTSAPATTTTPSTAPPTPPTSTATVMTPAAGQVMAGDQSILDAANGNASLALFAGRTASANAVKVQAVSADEGFWLGTSNTNRVWVALTGQAGESGVNANAGDRVSFMDAAVVPTTADYATKAGVSKAEGAAQLTAQGQHLEVAKNQIQTNP